MDCHGGCSSSGRFQRANRDVESPKVRENEFQRQNLQLDWRKLCALAKADATYAFYWYLFMRTFTRWLNLV
jgi:hypothetical protein